jgi:hypothetical protein
VAASPGKEAAQELGPAESGRRAFTAIGLDLGFVVGAVMSSFVFPALNRRTEHGLAIPGDVFGDGRDRRLAVRAWRELFLEALERV